MLTENDIVDILRIHLEKSGYKIIQSLSTNERGIDLIVENENEILYVEAKGETSSKSHTSRYGQPFSSNQIQSHISKAILASMKLVTSKPSQKKTRPAIALPDRAGYRQLINSIRYGLNKLDIMVYWVSEDNVEID